MINTLKRQDAIEKYPILPLRVYNPKKDEDDIYFPKVYANYVLTLSAKSYNGYLKLIGTELRDLAAQLNADSLIFLGDIDLPWRYRDDDYKPAKEALEYLADNKIGKRFRGAIEVTKSELPTFMKHLAWLVSRNAVLPYVHFTDPEQTFMGSICQYGSLHISTKNKKTDTLFRRLIAKSIFRYIKSGICDNLVFKGN